MAKEHIEIFGEGKAFVIEDFRSARLYAGGREKKETLRNQDKGQLKKRASLAPLSKKELPHRFRFRNLKRPREQHSEFLIHCEPGNG